MTTSTPGATRVTWGSKMAFILAAAGSAVGLGNIWGFPTIAAQNGGAAFVAIYLLAVLAIGAPVMLAELIIGRRSQLNPVGAFKKLAPGTAWRLLGGLGVLTGLVILSFYTVIAGWTLAYIFKTISGTFTAGADTAAIFADMSSSPVQSIGWHLAFTVITIYVVTGGIRDGIERWTKILMPMLAVLLVLLAVRAITLPGAGPGLEFYLKPDFSKVTGPVILGAIGQAFFSLSLGMGAMITYGSYISKRDDLVSSAGLVTLFDTAIALLAGLIILPTLISAGLEPGAGGPGMVFVVLASLLGSIPPEPYGGVIFGTGFFLLLAIAALTSSVSLLEVVVTWTVDERGTPRTKAAVMFGMLAFLIGVPSALGNGAVGWLTSLPGLGVNFLTFMFIGSQQFALVIGALLISLFVGWFWGVGNAREEVLVNDGKFPLERTWTFLIRYVCPVAIVAILVQIVWSFVG